MIVLNNCKRTTDINLIKLYPNSVDYQHKINIMKKAFKSAKDYNSEISQVSVNYLDKEQNVLIANTEGLYTEDKRVETRLSITSVASRGNENKQDMKDQELVRDLNYLKI